MKRDSSFFREISAMTLSVMGALIFNIGGVFAGRTAVLLNQIVLFLPWVFLIYPLLLTVRGDINGILASRLGSALHLGTIKPSWRNNTREFKELIFLIYVVSFYDATLVSIIGYLSSLIFKLNTTYLSILTITITTFMIGSSISIVLTFTVTFFIFKRGGDPDVYVYPIMSTVNDVLITIIYFLSCIFYRPWKTKLDLFVGTPLVVIILISLIVVFITKFRDTISLNVNIKQVLPSLTITTFVAAVTGSVLASFETILEHTPIFIVIYPAILDTVGDQSSILANSTTTKLHLGTIDPSLHFIKEQSFIRTLLPIIIGGILMSIILSIIGFSLYPYNIGLLLFLKFSITLILADLIAFITLGYISAIITVLMYRYGLDPDNLIVPLLSTFADLTTTFVLASLFQLILI